MNLTIYLYVIALVMFATMVDFLYRSARAGAASRDTIPRLILLLVFVLAFAGLHSDVLSHAGMPAWLVAAAKTLILLPVATVALPAAYLWGCWRE